MSDIKANKLSKAVYLMSQFSLIKAGVTGVTESLVKEQVAQLDYKVTEEYAKEFAEKQKLSATDSDAWLEFLLNVDAIEVEQEAAARDRINSQERIMEVINDVKDFERVKSILDQLVALKKELNPLISNKAECSLALKNKTAKDVTSETAGEAVSEHN